MAKLASLVAALFGHIRGTSVQEVEVKRGSLRIRLRKSAGGGLGQNGLQGSLHVPSEPPAIAAKENIVDVSTPVSGVFYWAPIPGGEPFIREGDVVYEGQIVGLIEAMKTFNEVVTHVAGTLVRFVVENGSQVEEGNAILQVRPHDPDEVISNGPTYAMGGE